jgi:hypothetical protein
LASGYVAFGCGGIYEDVQDVNIFQQIDGDYAVAAGIVDEEIAGGGEEEGFGHCGALGFGGLEDSNVDVVAKVRGLYRDSALSAEVAHKGGFVGEDFPAKPVFEGVVHLITIAPFGEGAKDCFEG